MTCQGSPPTPTSRDSTEQGCSVASPYGEAYYKTGNYENYLDRGPKYAALAKEIVNWLSTCDPWHAPALDFGCGVGHLVAGLRTCGVECYGYDPSAWAVRYGREELGVRGIYSDLSHVPPARGWHLMTAFDVFEHMNLADVSAALQGLRPFWLLVRIPVSKIDGRPYVLPCSERDPTHRLRLTKASWAAVFRAAGYVEVARPDLKHWWDSEGVYCALFRRTDSER